MDKLALFFKKESSKDALRNILCVIIPGVISFYAVGLQLAIACSVGALLASLTDLPGNRKDKWTSAKWCIPIFFITSASVSYFFSIHSWFVVVLLGIFGFAYSMIAVLGLRISFIGNLGLIVGSFTIGLRPHDPLIFTIGVTLGSIIFFSILLIQGYISPYRSLRYAIDDAIENMARLIRLKIDCYDENTSLNKTYKDLSILHVRVSDQLESVRSLLLREKELINSVKSETKLWLSKLYKLVDLYELLMAIDTDYENVRSLLKDTNALPLVRIALENLAKETENIRLSDNKNTTDFKKKAELQAIIQQIETIAAKSSHDSKNITVSIAQHLEQISTILSIIKSNEVTEDSTWVDTKKYIDFAPAKSSINAIFKNLNFNAPIFTYAIRMSLLLMLAGLIGYLLPEFRYASWIILTVILVARPTYKITQKRNFQRIIGTILGIILSFIIFYLVTDILAQLCVAAICMYMYLLFSKPNYLVCVIFVTAAIIVCLHIYEGHTGILLGSRFAFTLIGSLLAVLGCLAIPINHYRNIEKTTDSLILSFKNYLQKIEENLYTNDINYYELRLQRRFTQMYLANSYDSLDQLSKEPGNRKKHNSEINHFQSLAYRINALLVGLSVNITKSISEKETFLLKDRISKITLLINESENFSNQINRYKKQK